MEKYTLDLNRETPLYDRTLNVKVLSTKGNSDPHATRGTPLTFRILQGTGSAAERFFHFELTDENDPFFLYVLELSEQDFPALKREQSILVDFNAFPSMLIELLLLCSSNGIHDNEQIANVRP